VLHAVLAAVVHLSNCEFETPEKAELKDESKAAVEKAASLLGIDVAALLESLTIIRTVTRGEEITRPYTVEQAYDCRDATSKALYSRLFGWIVMKVNEKLAPELHSRRAQRPGVASSVQQPSYEIGVLDIFGFENFKDNSFEQMCINVAHEQLQFFFNQHTFRLELAEYDLEGIDGGAAKISFTDNKPLLDMFIARPLGLFALLDEECTLPKATDTSFTNKIDKIFGENPFYKVILKSRGHPAFAVAHFPGNVEYNGTHFLEKNRDNLAAPIVEVMQASKVDLVADSFNAEINENGQLEMAEKSQQVGRERKGWREGKSEKGGEGCLCVAMLRWILR
jgi:myosin heavy subunit